MPSDAVLGFDTSGHWCAAALIAGGLVRAQRVEPMAKGQAEALIPLLDSVLAAGGCGWQDLAAIGVGIGPGNFTGIRISVATARGLALALGIPAIGVSRFDALALDGPDLPVVVPALRGQVWVRAPGAAPVLAEVPPAPALHDGRHPLAVAIARLAEARRHQPQPRPAPMYLREADAAPSADTPPALLA